MVIIQGKEWISCEDKSGYHTGERVIIIQGIVCGYHTGIEWLSYEEGMWLSYKGYYVVWNKI